MQPQVNEPTDGLGRSGEAVHDAARGTELVSQHPLDVFQAVPLMYDHREFQFRRQPAMGTERALLDRSRLMLAEEVEAGFADRPDVGVPGQVAKSFDGRRVEAAAVVRMYAYRGVPAGKTVADFKRTLAGREVGPHHQGLGHASASGALVDGVQVLGKARIGQVGVTVEQPDYPSKRGKSGGPPGMV